MNTQTKTRLSAWLSAFLAGLLILAGCTENRRARSFGGTANEALPPGRKLVVATWKQDSLWLLTRPMQSNDIAETYEFRESSSFGIIEGRVIIMESR